MGKRKTCLLVMLILALILSLSGCKKVYTSKDMIEYAEQTLEDKYGEEFQVRGDVFNVKGSSYKVNVSPVNNPEIIFEAVYNVEGSEYDYDLYIESIVASQYKALVEEQLGEISCDYYLSTRLYLSNSENTITNTNITIEEYNNLVDEEDQNPKFKLYLSQDILLDTDKSIYERLLSIIEIGECRLDIFIITKEDLELVKSEFSERYELDGSTMTYIFEQYASGVKNGKKGYIHFLGGEQEKSLSYEEFTKIMEEIREDAKQW